MERKSGRVVVLVLAGHALAAAWTWRDIRQQPAQQAPTRLSILCHSRQAPRHA
jgi:hypothetical protein